MVIDNFTFHFLQLSSFTQTPATVCALPKPNVNKERDSTLPTKLLMLFQLMAVLRAGRWTIKQLTERFDCGKSTVYRYLELLEEAGFCVEKDFHNRYFVMTTDDDPVQAQFTIEEMNMVRSLIQTDAQHPLAASVLKKLSLSSELDVMPQLFLKAHLGNLVEQLTHAYAQPAPGDIEKFKFNEFHSMSALYLN